MATTKVPTSKSVQDSNRAKAAKMLGGAAAKSVKDSIQTKKMGGAVMKKAMGGAAKASGRKGKC